MRPIVICGFICCTAIHIIICSRTWNLRQISRTQPRRLAADEYSFPSTDFDRFGESPNHADFGNIQTKIARKGIDYLARAADLIIQSLMHNVRIPERISIGSLTLADVTVSDYQATDRSWIKLEYASGFTWRKENVTVDLEGHLIGRIGHHRLQNGSIHATLSGVKISVSLESFERSGRFYIVFQSCSFNPKHTSLQYLSVKPQHLSSLLGRYSDIILETLEAHFSKEYCLGLKNFVQAINEKMAAQNVNLPIFQLDSSIFATIADALSKNASPRMVRQFLQILLGLHFDASMVRNPKNELDTFNLWLSGEISHSNGSGPLPFTRNDLTDKSLARMYDKMAYLTISDFVINSFFYRMHEQLDFDVKVNRKESPKLAPLLRFSCKDSEICISFLFPELADLYYDHSSEIVFSRTENAPKLIIKPGIFALQWECVVTLNAIWRSKPKVVLKVKMTSEAELRPWLVENGNNTKLNGTVKIVKFDGRLLESAVGSIDQEKLDQLGIIVPPVAEKLLDDILKKGLPLPSLAWLRLDYTTLRILDRMFRLETDFALHPDYFKKIIREILSSTIYNKYRGLRL